VSYARLKRCLDLVGAFLLIGLLLPLMILVAAAIALGRSGPILYRQRRAGLNGAVFTIVKFRTMRVGPDQPDQYGHDYDRITRLGGALRRLRIDELPQLLNVLRGHMSLVGPRPLPPNLPGACDLPEFTARHRVRPGITGLAKVHDPNASPAQQMVCDRKYAERYSLMLDLRILLRTPWAVVRGSRPRPAPRSSAPELVETTAS
jgi:lipopolysaccharide/colanic/teichoic acid biosynthesis glycosyltransferase